MLLKGTFDEIKKKKIDYIILFLALISAYLVFKQQYVVSFILAITSIGLYQYYSYLDSKRIKEQLLKNQKEEIKRRVKYIIINPNKISQSGDSISKIIVFGLILFFILNQWGTELGQYPGEIQKSINIISAAKTPPYILTENRTVNIVFLKTDGNLGHWTVPFDSLDSSIKRGFYRREFIPNTLIPMIDQMYGSYLPLCVYTDCSDFVENHKETMSELQEMSIPIIKCKTLNNTIIDVPDYTVFVENIWKNVIPPIYYESKSDYEFIYEVWNIVTQLNIYSYDLEETPRYPLETFLAGGGDCEDTSILFASMIKSAPTNWEVDLVFLDSENPFNFKKLNHVMVYVNTGDEQYLIETTSKFEIQPYDKLVDGCYIEI